MASILTFAGFFAPHKGGAEDVMNQTLEHLARAGYNVDLITCNTEKVLSHEISNGVEIWRVPCWNMLHGTYPVPLPLPDTFRIVNKLFHKKHDAVYSYCRFYPSTFWAMVFSKMKRVPFVLIEFGTRHTVTDHKVVNFFGEIYDHTFGSIAVGSTTTLIGICHATESFLAHIGGKNIVLISPPTGLDMTIFKKNNTPLKQQLGLQDKIVISSVSRLIFAKGVQDLISAFPSIKEKTPNAVLIIVGDGPYKQELVNLANKIDNKNIIFTGFKNAAEIADILNISDVFVSPSYSEGLLAGTIIEAGAIGIPSVISDVGGAREIIQDRKNGLFVQPRDISAIAEKVCELIHDKSLHSEISTNISLLIHERWNWDNILPHYLKEFSAVIDKENQTMELLSEK